ncbi:MAG: hypothetical protein ACRD9L_09395, partial [Bryobacteraceae bacterium]
MPLGICPPPRNWHSIIDPVGSVDATKESILEFFETQYEEKRKASSAIQQRDNPKRPLLLFHYTNVAGLKGIVESGSLWCTNTAFLNDATELAYGLQLANQVAQELTGLSADILNEACLAIEKKLDVYAACFCERGDLLNQWHGYGKRGAGYSIGLAVNQLVSITPAEGLLLP